VAKKLILFPVSINRTEEVEKFLLVASSSSSPANFQAKEEESVSCTNNNMTKKHVTRNESESDQR
jgi:hypothetical protein